MARGVERGDEEVMMFAGGGGEPWWKAEWRG